MRPNSPSSLGRQIASSLALLVAITGMLSAGLLLLHVRVTAALEATHADGRAAQEALGLALAVREHYLHETHTVIQADRAHVGHHDHWIDDIERRIAELQPRVPESERATLERLRTISQAIDRHYRDELLPAALAGDLAAVRAHQQASEQRLREASEAADGVVAALDQRAEATRRGAVELSRVAIVIGVIGVAIIGVAALVIATRLRRAVLVPLGRLAAAADRFGTGDFEFRVGELFEARPGRAAPQASELHTLGQAFDRMAIELEARERRLVQTERVAAIGQLTAGIAHELNNPIGVIRGYLKTMIPALAEHDPSPAELSELREELAILDEEAAACQRIVEDLLGYAREPRLEPRELELDRLILAASQRFASSPRGRERKLALDVEPARADLDPLRVQQVLTNLLDNAAAASPVEAPIELVGRVCGERYRIEVCDRGRGIDPDKRERVFEPFFSERRGGSGLGLALSRGIVEAHGGTIAALDPLPEQQGGARIVIELPCHATKEDPA
ncbi:sensor histidine kinase [Nannocystaceae bacterium ST9]